MPRLTFKERIDKIQELSGLSPTAMEEKCKLGQGVITKKYRSKEPDAEISPNSTRIFLEEMGINKVWWETGEGEVFIKKPTSVENSNTNEEKMKDPESIYRDLVESNSEYRLIPKTILSGEYRIILKSEIDEQKKLMAEVIADKNELIARLRKEISDLESRLRPAVVSKDA